MSREPSQRIKGVYTLLGPRFRREGYRLERGASCSRVVLREDAEHLRVFRFEMGPLAQEVRVNCWAGVSYPRVDSILEPLFCSPRQARQHPLACTFVYVAGSEKAVQTGNFPAPEKVEELAEKIWFTWTQVQPWFLENSDLRRAARQWEQSGNWPAQPASFPTYSAEYVKLVAIYHHLSEAAEVARCVAAMVDDCLRRPPESAWSREAPAHWAFALLRYLRWVKRRLGVVLPELRGVRAWCEQCMGVFPLRTSMMYCKDDPSDREWLGFQHLLADLGLERR